VAQPPQRLCTEFSALLSKPPYLLGLELEDIVDDRGKRRIPNVDVDHDGLIDAVYWQCPGQGSPVPADPCNLSVELAAGKKVEFQEYGFRLVIYRSDVYALSASVGPNRTKGKGRMWRVDGNGITLVCAGL